MTCGRKTSLTGRVGVLRAPGHIPVKYKRYVPCSGSFSFSKLLTNNSTEITFTILFVFILFS